MTKPGFEPQNIEMKVGRSILFTIRTPKDLGLPLKEKNSNITKVSSIYKNALKIFENKVIFFWDSNLH
jgi:hypothetical protein